MNTNGSKESGSITDRAMLVSLSIKAWSATKHDKKISAEVAVQHGSDENMGRFSKRLISRDALEKIRKIDSSARLAHYERTVPWDDNNRRALLSIGFNEYSKMMSEFELNRKYALKEFMAGYPAYYQAAKGSLNGLFDADDYPTCDQIEAKFQWKLAVSPIDSAENFVVQSLDSAIVERIRRDITEEQSARIQGAMKDVWQRLHDVCSRMSERLHAYQITPDGVEGTFRDSLVSNVSDLINILPTLNLANDPKLIQIGEHMRQALTSYSPSELREQDTARARVAADADRIVKEIGDFLA